MQMPLLLCVLIILHVHILSVKMPVILCSKDVLQVLWMDMCSKAQINVQTIFLLGNLLETIQVLDNVNITLFF